MLPQSAGRKPRPGRHAVARGCRRRVLDPRGKPPVLGSSSISLVSAFILKDIKGIVLEVSGNRLHEGVLEVRRLRQELSIAAGEGRRRTTLVLTIPQIRPGPPTAACLGC